MGVVVYATGDSCTTQQVLDKGYYQRADGHCLLWYTFELSSDHYRDSIVTVAHYGVSGCAYCEGTHTITITIAMIFLLYTIIWTFSCTIHLTNITMISSTACIITMFLDILIIMHTPTHTHNTITIYNVLSSSAMLA